MLRIQSSMHHFMILSDVLSRQTGEALPSCELSCIIIGLTTALERWPVCSNTKPSNCLAGRAPEYLIELCHSVTDIPARRNLRSSSQVQLLVPRYRKERSGKRGFSISSPQLWTLLPADIRLLHNDHQLFRRRLKTHYMQQSMLCHWRSMSTVWTLLLLLNRRSASMRTQMETLLRKVPRSAARLVLSLSMCMGQRFRWNVR